MTAQFRSTAAFLALVALLATTAAASTLVEATENELLLRAWFSRWVIEHGKVYHAFEEEEHRFNVFLDNLLFINRHNTARKYKFTLGLNPFADLTHDEFMDQYLGYRGDKPMPFRESRPGFRHANVEAADSVDWRQKGAVTAVKNQLQCGNTLTESANVVSIDGYEDVPSYIGLLHVFVGIGSYGWLSSQNDESSLKKAVTMQPVSVAIEADEREFQFYKEGILDAPCGTGLDHGVLAVGYGVENGTGYWLVKNSWGPLWGDHGYIKLAMGLNGGFGQCGIAMKPSYPTQKAGPGPAPPKPKPTPPPGPVECDRTHLCPENTSCCCLLPVKSYCFSWGCCPMPSATCCADHKHCCPSEYPVCDAEAGTCAKSDGSATVAISVKTRAERVSRRFGAVAEE
eukprot:jgi/Chlat1/6565/Chrsp45S06034